MLEIRINFLKIVQILVHALLASQSMHLSAKIIYIYIYIYIIYREREREREREERVGEEER